MWWRRAIVTVVLIGAVIALLARVLTPSNVTQDVIETAGIVEATEVHLSAALAGRAVELPYREGDLVEVGAVVVRLEDQEHRALVAQARAATARARAEVLLARATLEKVRTLAAEAERQFQRLDALYQEEVAAEAAWEAAQARAEAGRAEIREAQARVAQAEALVEEARAELAMAEVRLGETVIRSPLLGTVVSRIYEVGERVTPGTPILTLVDLDHRWARVDLEETLVGGIHLGDVAWIWSEAVAGQEFEGRVIEIGREGEFATQRDVTRGRQDIRTFRVKVALTDPEGYLKPGMTVMVRLALKRPS